MYNYALIWKVRNVFVFERYSVSRQRLSQKAFLKPKKKREKNIKRLLQT